MMQFPDGRAYEPFTLRLQLFLEVCKEEMPEVPPDSAQPPLQAYPRSQGPDARKKRKKKAHSASSEAESVHLPSSMEAAEVELELEVEVEAGTATPLGNGVRIVLPPVYTRQVPTPAPVGSKRRVPRQPRPGIGCVVPLPSNGAEDAEAVPAPMSSPACAVKDAATPQRDGGMGDTPIRPDPKAVAAKEAADEAAAPNIAATLDAAQASLAK